MLGMEGDHKKGRKRGVSLMTSFGLVGAQLGKTMNAFSLLCESEWASCVLQWEDS